MQPKYLSYGGSFLLLLSVVGFIEGSREKQYESTVSRLKGTVIAKGMRALRLGTVYGVTYRVTIQSRSVEREGDVGSRRAWDAIRVGDEVDVESVGVEAQETRLPVERFVSSGLYRGIAAAFAVAGVGLLVWRFRGGRSWSAAKPQR